MKSGNLLILLFLALTISACEVPSVNENATATSATAPLDLRETPTPMATVTPSCEPSKVSLNELANVTLIEYYRWSYDSQFFYFQLQEGDDWWVYSPASQKLIRVSNSEMLPTPPPTKSAVEQFHQSILGEDYSITAQHLH